MASNQTYKEYRVLELPTIGLVAGDRYYLNVGPDKYKTFIVSDNLILTGEAGNDFIEKDTMAELRAISTREIWAIQNSYYKSVKLNGYYTAGDTPAPIDYYISETTDPDDGGSVIATGAVKFTHDFGDNVDAIYFGTNYGNINDSLDSLKRASDYVIKNNKNLIIFNAGYIYNLSDSLVLLQGSNYSIIGKNKPIFNCLKQNTSVIRTPINSEVSFGNIVEPSSIIKEGDYNLTLTSVENISIGDIIRVHTTELLGPLSSTYRKGEYFKVRSITGNTLTFDHSFGVDMIEISNIQIIKPIMRKNVIIEGIKFISTGTNAITARFDNLEDSVVKFCDFSTNSTTCIVGANFIAYNLTIHDCYSEKAFIGDLSTGYGYNLAGYNVTIRDCIAKDCKHGVTVAPSQHICSQMTIQRCKVYNSKGQKALDIHGGAYNCRIEDCEVYNSAALINIRGFKDLFVLRNKFYGDTSVAHNQQCIDIRSEATGVLRNLRVEGNTIFDFNNVVIATTFENIILNSIIQGNIVRRTGRFINISSTASRNTKISKSIIQNNIVSDSIDNTNFLVRISGDDNTISQNILSVNQGNGLEIQGLEADISKNNIVESNFITKEGSTTAPIVLTYANKTIVRFNSLLNGYVSKVVHGTGVSNTIAYSNLVDADTGFLADAALQTIDLLPTLDRNQLVSSQNLVSTNKWWMDTNKVFVQRGSLTSSTDFNTLIRQGNYVLGTLPSSDFLTYNIPVQERGILVVFEPVVNNFITQIYTTTEGKSFIRSLFNTTWSVWSRIDSLTEILSTTRPSLSNGTRKVFLETDTNRIVSGQGGSSTTTWRDAMGVVIT